MAVAGNIGVGKSTLTGMLAEAFGWEPFYEANAENPYLADFYEDMSRWGFHSQMFYLGKRLEDHRQLLNFNGSVVQDRSVYEDAEIFARNLFDRGMMSERDYDAYRRLYQAITAFVPPPDLILYLQASVPTLLKRIAIRGREYEKHIAPDYLMALNTLYEDWVTRWTACPVLCVSTDDLNFPHNAQDMQHLVDEIKRQLLHLSS